MSEKQARPITAEVLSTPGSVSQEVRNEKFTKLAELSETARLTEAEVITYKIDLLCICAEQRDGWKQEKAKDFWKVNGAFAEDIKAIAKAVGVSEGNLQVQSKISHPWFSDLLPMWNNDTNSYHQSTMYQPIIERYAKLHTASKRMANRCLTERKDDKSKGKSNALKLFKSFDIDCKDISDLNVLQIQEQVFRHTVKSMKEYIDQRNGGNGKGISIELFNGILALPDVDADLDTTKTCREYTKNLEAFDFKDADIDYDNMIISQPVASDNTSDDSKSDNAIDVDNIDDKDLDNQIEKLTLQSDELAKQLTEVNEAIVNLKERKDKLASEKIDEMSDEMMLAVIAKAKATGLLE